MDTKDKIPEIEIEQFTQEREQLRCLEKNIRKIRHNIKNELLVVLSCIETGKLEEAKQYIFAMQNKSLNSAKDYLLTDNNEINTVLNIKISVCHIEGILCSCKILTKLKHVPSDISLLLSQMFDNAIEASVNSQEKLIQLEMSQMKEWLVIKMRNSISESVLHNNPKLHTTKQDREDHGFGIPYLKELAAKYNGCIDFLEAGEKSKYFCVQLMLQVF